MAVGTGKLLSLISFRLSNPVSHRFVRAVVHSQRRFSVLASHAAVLDRCIENLGIHLLQHRACCLLQHRACCSLNL
jgi:uncharacterized protein VirK/YbjX